MSVLFTMQAINLYDSIQIKRARPLIDQKVVFTSPQELVFQFSENRFLWVFRFGALVFMGFEKDQIDSTLHVFKEAFGPGLSRPASESYQIIQGEMGNRVEFETVELKKLSIDSLRLIAVSVAQSAGLEHFELKADELLYETSRLMEKLSEAGTVSLRNKSLLKFIGSVAANRQNIVSHLSILDPPEETWKSKELEKLHREIQGNFDIDTRFKTLDRKMSLIQDNLEILSGLVTGRRTTLLESMIVILIVLEIVLAVLSRA